MSLTATTEPNPGTGLLDRWARSVMATYAPPPIALVRGAGSLVWDDQGREYVDLVGGIAVNLLGHAHPAVVEAVARQILKVVAKHLTSTKNECLLKRGANGVARMRKSN